MTEPRAEIHKIGDAAMSEALDPLSWPLIRDRMALMDHCALGGVSADATLIGSLALALYRARTAAGVADVTD